MPKKLIFVLVLAFFFLSCRSVFAGLTINEIMYDLSGSDSVNSKSREWIEVYNSNSTDISIDASKWRVFDGGANRTINGEVNFSVPALGYVIFAGDKDTFLLDHPGFTGVVYDTGITSLNNTGATLKILDQDGSSVDLVTYGSAQGGAGDGNSLQKISGSWSGATPTPGTANETITPPPPPPPPPADNSSSSGNNNTGSSSGGSAPKTVEIQKTKTQITAKALGFVGLPLSLDATTFGSSGELLRYGKYFWNFGDGDSKEAEVVYSGKFTHTYFYPGDYVVSLSYYSNYYSNIPDASDQIIIKIIETNITISRVGDEKDFFVELSNNTDFNADLSGWFLMSDRKNFNIPRNTILAAKKKMIISPRITNFSVADKNTLKLMNSAGEVVFAYSNPARVVLAGEQTPSSILPLGKGEMPKAEGVYSETEIPVENLQASVTESGTEEKNFSNSSFPIIPLASFIFIGASAGAVYFIRRNKVISEKAEDFEILDE